MFKNFNSLNLENIFFSKMSLLLYPSSKMNFLIVRVPRKRTLDPRVREGSCPEECQRGYHLHIEGTSRFLFTHQLFTPQLEISWSLWSRSNKITAVMMIETSVFYLVFSENFFWKNPTLDKTIFRNDHLILNLQYFVGPEGFWKFANKVPRSCLLTMNFAKLTQFSEQW